MNLQTDPRNQLSAVEAELFYLAPMAERPHTYTYDPPPGLARTNAVPEPHTMPIRDARPIASLAKPDGSHRVVVIDAPGAFHVSGTKLSIGAVDSTSGTSQDGTWRATVTTGERVQVALLYLDSTVATRGPRP